MSVPPNSATIAGSWSPERELNESAPRRYAPSPYTDLNQPNALVLLGGGGLLLVVGIALFFFASAKGIVYLLLGIVFALGGAAMISTYPVKRKQHLERAANLVENGAPMMARIVKVDNATGDSQYGRIVTYMVNLPGMNEEVRREVKADDRTLPKTIPGPTTALLDFRSGDVELYCALPYVAVSKFGATAAAQSDLSKEAGLPTQAPATPTMGTTAPMPRPATMRPAPTTLPQAIPTLPTVTPAPEPATMGDMATLGAMGTQAPPPEPEPVKETKRPTPPADSGAAKLPWES